MILKFRSPSLLSNIALLKVIPQGSTKEIISTSQLKRLSNTPGISIINKCKYRIMQAHITHITHKQAIEWRTLQAKVPLIKSRKKDR
mmetsp:Transcript_1347/g.1223  ORF Transcript_1347/g.1223 Transcript_1347/m.1223 type:complete len:87 (+) Transcript_1347:2-262(+)